MLKRQAEIKTEPELNKDNAQAIEEVEVEGEPSFAIVIEDDDKVVSPVDGRQSSVTQLECPAGLSTVMLLVRIYDYWQNDRLTMPQALRSA